MDFTEEQLQRYSRHIILPEVGGKGQKKISSAKVFIVGAGGLGCPVGFYLTAAGVGDIALIDNDNVELSNLQRQIAHSTKTLGMNKAESAKKTFETLNPDVNISVIKERINSKNIIDLIKDYDIVVDGS
ncbi:MAG: HesA/MoeB/ThiF family protein, partial [Thermodesulfovibrionia bacterium]|nr:HesA/MoeB/ThiF family protein [Thermodesulfovibrionia bacterium]